MADKKFKIINLSDNSIIDEVSLGEQYDLVKDEVSIKIIDEKGAFFLEALAAGQEGDHVKVTLNDSEVIDVAEGKSGDVLSIDNNRIGLIAPLGTMFSNDQCHGDFHRLIDAAHGDYLKKISKPVYKATSIITLGFVGLFLLIEVAAILTPVRSMQVARLPQDLIIKKGTFPDRSMKEKMVQSGAIVELNSDTFIYERDKTKKKGKPKIIASASEPKKIEAPKVKKVNPWDKTVVAKSIAKLDASMPSDSLKKLDHFGKFMRKNRKNWGRIRNQTPVKTPLAIWNQGIKEEAIKLNIDEPANKRYIAYLLLRYKSFLPKEAKEELEKFNTTVTEQMDALGMVSILDPEHSLRGLQDLNKGLPKIHPAKKDLTLMIKGLK